MRIKAFGIAAALAACAILTARRVGEAHAVLLSSEPAANAKLALAPQRIRLLFSERVNASVSSIQLIGGASAPRELTVAADPQTGAALIAPLSALASGGYRVVWRTVSADGHRAEGGFSFTVVSDTTPAIAPAPPPAPAVSERGVPRTAAFVRGVAIALAMALAGLLFFVRGTEATETRAMTVCSWLSVAAVVAIATHFIVWSASAVVEGGLNPSWIGKMAQTRPGMTEVARWAVAFLAMLFVVVWRRPGTALVFALITLAISAAIGHPAATQPLIAIPTMAVHLAGGAAWLGGLLWILVADRSQPERFARGAHRVSEVALWCVIAVFASGGIQTLVLVHPISGLLSMPYGWLLAGKIGVALILVLIGGYHRYRAMPAVVAARGDFGPSLRVEIVLMIVVVMMAGLLSYLPPK